MRESRARVALLVVVISCHLALLVLVSGPTHYAPDRMSGMQSNSAAIALRFFRPRRPIFLHVPVPSQTHSVPKLQRPMRRSKSRAKPSTAQRIAPDVAPASETYRTSTPNPTNVYSLNEGSLRDGGFQGRLLRAKPAYGTPRLPGSEAPVVTGIQLTDPRRQGVGAAMRNAQRLFGIRSRQCIDVDAWRSLTPQQLSARHISPGEVDKMDERYACNAPPGLHF